MKTHTTLAWVAAATIAGLTAGTTAQAASLSKTTAGPGKTIAAALPMDKSGCGGKDGCKASTPAPSTQPAK